MRSKNRKWISFVIALVIAVSILFSGAVADSTVSVKVNGTLLYDEARSMLSLINDFRTGDDAWYLAKDNQTKVAAKNLNALSYDYDLEKVAMQRAEEIAVYFNHDRPDGSPWKTIYPSGKIARGENIGYGSGGTITITGGTVTAVGASYPNGRSGAGIGAGRVRNSATSGDSGNITITEGTIGNSELEVGDGVRAYLPERLLGHTPSE